VKQRRTKSPTCRNLLQRFKRQGQQGRYAKLPRWTAWRKSRRQLAEADFHLEFRTGQPPNPMLRDATPTLATLRLTRLKAATDRGLRKTSAISGWPASDRHLGAK
jgi:hypothetical protein